MEINEINELIAINNLDIRDFDINDRGELINLIEQRELRQSKILELSKRCLIIEHILDYQIEFGRNKLIKLRKELIQL